MAERCCHILSEYQRLLTDEGLLLSRTGGPTDTVTVRHLSFDTRDMRPETLFFCKGVHFKPAYLTEAVAAGAVAYVSETPYEGAGVPGLIVSDVRRAMSLLALFHYDRPAEKLTTVGITGTKGKSTTAYYLKAILDAALPRECAILSSIDNYDGVIREESHLTTPEAVVLQQHLNNAYESGLTHLVMEVSSQALKYGRVDGVTFDIGLFTNIGTDHISPVEHPDFEDYYASKCKLFAHCRTACIDTDAEHAGRTVEAARRAGCRVVTCGSHPIDDFRVSNVRKENGEIAFRVEAPAYTDEFRLTMSGLFNVENALLAIAAATLLGIDREAIRTGLYTARAAGRMEVFSSRDGRLTAIVDYAHNRMSFEALYVSVEKEYPGKRIFTVFGCPGGKAFLRRRDLGELSGRHSALTFITEEDSGEEPFSSIASDIAAAVSDAGGRYLVEEDRGEAIRLALLENGTDKVVLITGKGRETRQKRGTQYIDTPSDVDYVEQYLAAYDKVSAEQAGLPL